MVDVYDARFYAHCRARGVDPEGEVSDVVLANVGYLLGTVMHTYGGWLGADPARRKVFAAILGATLDTIDAADDQTCVHVATRRG